MKTKTLKAAFVASALALTFIFSSYIGTDKYQQEDGEGYVMVRVYEMAAKNPVSQITIVYEDGTVENIPLNMFGPKTLEPNLVTIQGALSKLKAKGYTLVSNTGGPFAYGSITTYVFEKE
ncbi:MAG: hypothetical protein ACI976_002883 [Aureispira sp.]|jgi:hypothetical protein